LGDEVAETINRADAAMYKDKKARKRDDQCHLVTSPGPARRSGDPVTCAADPAVLPALKS
jgi:hypothetical protein